MKCDNLSRYKENNKVIKNKLDIALILKLFAKFSLNF